MRLDELLRLYTQHRVLRPGSIGQLTVSINVFGQFLGRSPRKSDLKRDTVNRFIDWLLVRRSANTAWNKRKDILTLWKWAWEESYLRSRPERIKRVRRPRRDPDAWTKEELRQILLATDEIPGTMRHGAPYSAFFRALVLVLYSTGLRISATLELPNRIAADGTLYADANSQKNHYHEQKQLQPLAVRAVRKLHRLLGGGQSLLLPWPYDKTHLYKLWRQLIHHAGIEPSRRSGTQKMRRTAASWLEAASPGSATRFLGHSSPTLAHAHYLDPKIIYAASTRTPPAF